MVSSDIPSEGTEKPRGLILANKTKNNAIAYYGKLINNKNWKNVGRYCGWGVRYVLDSF